MKKAATLLTCVTLTLAPLANGCGNQADSARTTTGRLNMSVLRAGQANYRIHNTPAKLARSQVGPVVVSGEVAGFSRGRQFFSYDTKPINRVIMHIKVTDKIQGPGNYISNGYAYVDTWAGVSYEDPAPRFNQAIPAGTQVVVFASPRTVPNDPDTKGLDAGHPPGTTVLDAGHPQCMVFQEVTAERGVTNTRLLGGREDLKNFGPAWTKANTMQEFVSTLKQQLRN